MPRRAKISEGSRSDGLASSLRHPANQWMEREHAKQQNPYVIDNYRSRIRVSSFYIAITFASPSSALRLLLRTVFHILQKSAEMSSEGLLKNGKKKVVIVGGGAAGMVSSFPSSHYCFSAEKKLLNSPAQQRSPNTPRNSTSQSSNVCPSSAARQHPLTSTPSFTAPAG